MKKILVIEDTKSILDSILDILRFEGFEGFGAENGKKGIDLVTKVCPALIICDIMMPEMDGYEVIDNIRNMEGYKSIPFIFLTALSTQQDHRKGMDIGADDYLTKPFTTEQLINAINSRLNKKEVEKKEMEKEVLSIQESISKSIPNELLTPLNSVIGINNLMSARANSLTPKDIESFTKDINESVQVMLKTIKKIIYFTEIELISKDQEKRSMIRNSVTTDAKSIVLSKIKELCNRYNRNSGVEADIQEINIKMDENHFKILVNEVLDNAFKFSAENDLIKVTLTEMDKAIFVVNNEGMGISPENLRHIMAFRQFDKDTYYQKGLGLGLSIIKRIVELYGGVFKISSQPGVDTKVSMALP